jgi:DNA repair exonuclease SbcCD ATPase subunit
MCDAAYAKVRYLIEELVTQRSESARFSIELAEAKAKAAEIETISRQREVLLAALIAALATRDRREADARSQTADWRQRLEAAEAEVQRKLSENDRLAAELAAAYKAADAATVLAADNLAVINAQIKVLQAAAGNAALARADLPTELLYAGSFDVRPAMPRQMLHPEETK